jgi:hypothetical protein
VPSLCCFWCPSEAPLDEVRSLDAACPDCGRSYGFPLQSPPTQIGRFPVEAPIARGFYGAAYRGVHPTLGTPVVLKLVPKAIYQHFNKNWASECRLHAQVARGTPLLANISDSGEAVVTFGDQACDCWWAVLDFVQGPTLESLLTGANIAPLAARQAAQVALDLLDLLSYLEARQVHHNDLHPGNIIVAALERGEHRADALSPATRVVAIDLGSASEVSRSGGERHGDQWWIAHHCAALAQAVRNANTVLDDGSFRMVEALQGLAEHLSPAATSQRVMTVSDARSLLELALSVNEEPWRQRLTLSRFSDGYNAQVLQPWHAGDLWWDPQGKWLQNASGRGPQVITGMRGCGKTILLRALQFHARYRRLDGNTEVPPPETLLSSDKWVGLYASCLQLLSPSAIATADASLPFERLYVAYLKDAVQALSRLRQMGEDQRGGTVEGFVRDALGALEFERELPGLTSLPAIRQFLTQIQFELSSGHKACRLKGPPVEGFAHLAGALRAAAPILADKYVLFLLDDVSTRYLGDEMVSRVISALLFQHPDCAFRITTEAQTLQRLLLSPGGGAEADPSRDYREFDLGREVYRLVQESRLGQGPRFIAEILRRRARFVQSMPEIARREPVEVLGDQSLEMIAKVLATASEGDPERKKAYWGLRALEAVCVGDVGDVVKLYETILQAHAGGALPVPPIRQSEAFLNHSSSAVHFLNRRNQDLKNIAIAFSRASGELLKRSARDSRLRQYTKLYVRVDATGRQDAVVKRLWALLDAGVFVYDGGTPRTKTRDADPVLQFKLSFKKLLGLASFIGLSDRDRFELSGEALERFLLAPEEAERTLLANLGGGEVGGDFTGEEMSEPFEPLPPSVQGELLLDRVGPQGDESESVSADTYLGPSLRLQSIQREGLGSLPKGATLVCARGFEERTASSLATVLNACAPRDVLIADYEGVPQGPKIDEVLDAWVGRKASFVSAAALAIGVGSLRGDVIVDVTGLSKPYVFRAIEAAIRANGRVFVVHTLAAQYAPRNEDLEAIGVRGGIPVTSELFSRIGEVLTGEMPPYEIKSVYSTDAQPELATVLIASASPKNDRLLHLCDARNYDQAFILVPPGNTPRQQVARASAELAARVTDVPTRMLEVGTNDLSGAIRAVEEAYRRVYHVAGAKVEFGLTGSKIHAVAFAAVAAVTKVASAWYVEPSQFDQSSFSLGVGATEVFELIGDVNATGQAS